MRLSRQQHRSVRSDYEGRNRALPPDDIRIKIQKSVILSTQKTRFPSEFLLIQASLKFA